MDTRAVFVLLSAVLNAVLAEVKYFELGGELSFEPITPTERISSITWKHRGNIVADYSDGGSVDYYADFKGRTTLALPSGVLTLRSMIKADEGNFTVEVNYQVQSVVYSAKETKSLRHSKVEVVKRPLTCNYHSQTCNLSCITDNTDSEAFQYFWKEGDGAWMKLKKDKEIIKNDQIKTFSCKIHNTISEKESDPLDNPFIQPPQISYVPRLVGIIFLVIIIVAGGALSVFAYKYPHKLAPCIPCVAGEHTERPTEGTEAEDKGASVPLTGKGLQSSSFDSQHCAPSV